MASTLSIPINEIKNLLHLLGFSEDGFCFSKYYEKHNYKLSVDFEKEEILYEKPIKLGDKTTSNFESSENFVVLECVDRLLNKGYPPFSISLEHKWSLGKQYKGKLDILVQKDEETYLMIECKTWGFEHEKEKKRMLKDGGQLFSYYKQSTDAKYLCLYSSKLTGEAIRYTNDIIKTQEEWKNLGEVKEVYGRWNKQFSHNGIFDEDIKPYGVQIQALTKSNLKELKKEDSSIIYNQFLEILRHNVVSDKSNAFDKIFNLFLCKIVDEDEDEDEGEGEQLKFQWVEGKTTLKDC